MTFAQHEPSAGGGASPLSLSVPPAPWGYVATIGWTVLALVVSTGVGIIGGIWWFGFDEFLRLLETSSGQYNGVLVSITTIISAPVQIAVVALAIRLKRWSSAAYLGLVLPRRKDIVPALVLIVGLVAVVEGATALLGRDVVSFFQVESYRTAKAAGWLPGMFIAIVLFAPLVEEIIFRGFVYRGFARQPGSEPLAIVVIALLWTMLHIQYDWRDLPQIFIIGVALGWIRWSSGSTVLTIALHALLNLWATIETAFKLEWLQS